MQVINAKGLIMGRLATKVAKTLLSGEEVIVVGVSDTIVTGSLRQEVDRLNSLKHQKSKTNPEHSPKYPRVPHMMFKRVVRGMLPKKTSRGREALHRLKAYSDVPETIDVTGAITYPEFAKKPARYTTLGAICKAFSYETPV